MNRLEGLRFHPSHSAHMGCIKGRLDHLGIDVSLPWVFGGTGHASVINMRETVCIIGPYAWDKRKVLDLAPKLGHTVQAIAVEKRKTPDDLSAQKQRQAWDLDRGNIDRGLPCYGFDLDPHILELAALRAEPACLAR